ncbi:MAG: hypothetical protein JXQ91_02550 [Vannielia sp.]|uniref:hypothetical protein n=1 Tax=Vannielia sp. TaxID=2813045 RepID=UPI003B8E6E9A
MFLRKTLFAALFLAPLAAGATTPEDLAALAASQGVAFDPAGGELSPGGTVIAFPLDLPGGDHVLRFYDCSVGGCGEVEVTSKLPNPGGMDGDSFSQLLKSGGLAAFMSPPLKHRITLKAEEARIVTAFETDAPEALAEALGHWRQGIGVLGKALADFTPPPELELPPVFRPEALEAVLAELGGIMERDDEGGARVPEGERSYMVSLDGLSYLAIFSGCRAEGCGALQLEAVVENRSGRTGAGFSEIYDDGRFGFLDEGELAYEVRPGRRTVTIASTVAPELFERRADFLRSVGVFHRYVTEVEAALATAPPAPDPLEVRARSPQELAELAKAIGYSASAVMSGGQHIVRVATRSAPILIRFQGGCAGDDPTGCRFVILSSSLELHERPGLEDIERYNAESYCCKAIWSAETRRLVHSMSLPLQQGIDGGLLRESLLIHRSQRALFERAFGAAQ